MRQRAAGVGVALVLAAVGTLVLVAYVRGADERAQRDERRVDVLVVKETVTKGTPADQIQSRVKSEKVPAGLRADGAVTSLTGLAGKVAAVDLLPGEQLVTGRFVLPGSAAAANVPPDLLQVTVPLDAARALGGDLRAGDRVGVVASFTQDKAETTHLMLHKILVTNVRTGQDGNRVQGVPAGTSPVGTLFVTLALDAPSVEKVVFAAEHGTLWLSLEPLEAPEGGTQVRNRQNVL